MPKAHEELWVLEANGLPFPLPKKVPPDETYLGYPLRRELVATLCQPAGTFMRHRLREMFCADFK